MADERIVRIGCGAGSWGDDVGEPRELLTRSHVDYLVLDYLAEITMSIMRRQMDRAPQAGFATDFVTVMRDILPLLAERGTKVVTNAGGLNPLACGRAIVELIKAAGLEGRIRVAVVDGDDLMSSLDEIAGAFPLVRLDDGQPLTAIRERVLSANAYLGARPIRAALDQGADIVLTGRCVDVALTLGPLLYEFDWADDDWDRIAAGVVAGHLLECGPQATGGNYHGWKDVADLDHVGYPIVEVDCNGVIVLTKADGTGGVVNRATATEQLLHEIFDPKAFLSPDVTVDWTSIVVDDLGGDRVRLSGMRGAPPPSTLRVSITYRDGYKVVLMWPYAWPDARLKGEAAIRKIEHTVARLGLRLDATRADIFGTGAIHGARIGATRNDYTDPPEVIVRFAARGAHREDIERLAAQQAPMSKGPPGLAGHIAGGKGQVTPIYSHWATLVPANAISARIQMLH